MTFQSQTGSALTLNIFYVLYNTWWKIIPMKNTLKTQSIHIFFIKYYIILTKIDKVKVEPVWLWKVKLNSFYGTEVVVGIYKIVYKSNLLFYKIFTLVLIITSTFQLKLERLMGKKILLDSWYIVMTQSGLSTSV